MPAAPTTITGVASEVSQDIRFGFFSSDAVLKFPSWIGAFFSTSETSEQDSAIKRIQIFPGNVSIRQKEQIVFSAVAFDAEDAPIGGVKFDWQIADTGRGLAALPLNNGRFEAQAIGTFTVTVNGGGQRAEAVITVNPSVSGSPSQSDSKPAPPKNISTSSDESDESATGNQTVESSDTKETITKDGQEINGETQNLLPEEGNWNNGNWGASDNPGNLPGNTPGHPADDGAGNGNFQLSAPVVSLPGRGIDLALNLNYNSRLWNKSGNELTYDIDHSFPAPGWSLGFGKMMDMGANGGSMLIDADGTRHGYSGTIYPGYYGGSTFQGYSTDGKFIDYTSYRDNAGIYSAQAYFPNGTYIYYAAKGDGAVHPVYIREANGNFITITYRNNQGPAIQTVTDTLGRIITFNYDSFNRLISVTAPRMQNEDPAYGTGATRTLLKLHYRPLTLNYAFASGITPSVRNNPVNVIDSIYYPSTGTGYWFGGADANSPDYSSFYSSYGMLAKVEEQRGMSWSAGSEEQGTVTAGQMTKRAVYNYPLTTANEAGRTNGINLSDAPTYTTLTENWEGMDVGDPAVTTYSINNNDYHSDGTSNSPSRTITVTQPNGTINKQYSYRTPGAWTDGLVFADETIVMNGSTPVIISSSLVSWQQGEYTSPRLNWGELTNENGNKVKTVYSYTGGKYNQVTRSCDYDNSYALVRCAVTQYDNSAQYTGQAYSYGYYGRHIFNLVTATGIENPDGTKASWTQYEYDNYQNQPLVNTPGVIQHEAVSDPYTTQTTTVQGECIQWEEHPYGGQYCVDWSYYEVSVYDAATEKRGNITKTTTYSNAQTLTGATAETRGYDITGNMVKSSSSCCEQTSIEFDDPNTTQIDTQYAYPVSQTRGSADPNSPSRITSYSNYDFQTGLIKQTTDPDGRSSTKMYNPDTLRPVKTILSTGAYTINSYDDTAMTVTEEIKEANGNQAGKTIKYLNGLGLVKREESLGANNVWDIVETKFNKYAEEWKQSRPYRAGDTPQWTERVYDLQGRLTQIIEPNGSITKAFYDETQRPDSASNLIGHTIRVVDAWGRERWGRYNQQDKLAEVVEPNPNGNGSVFAAGSLVTKYKHDTLGNLIETEQGSQSRKFSYDSLGKLTRQKLAEQTATLNDNGQYVGAGNAAAKWSEAFWYDNRSNLIMKTDARGAKTHFSYQISGVEDPLNRLQSKSYDLSGPLDPNITIHATPGVSYEYMTTGDKNRVKKIRTDGILTEDFIYDTESRISEYKQTVDYRASYPMTVNYLYDTLNRVTDVRYPAQYGLAGNPRKLVQNSYDVASRLSGLSVDSGQAAGNIVYNAADQTTSIKIGGAGRTQVTESYTYDPQTGLLTNQKVLLGSKTQLDLSYDYSRNNSVGTLGGKTGHTSKITNNLDNNKNREYEYDALGRLTKAKGGNSLWQQQYSYDRYGNRTNVVASGVAADGSAIPQDGIANLTYNTADNRITTAGFEYDSAGNQTRALAQDGTWLRYEYDGANRLQVVKKDDGTYLQAFQFGSTNARLMDLDYQYGYLKIFASSGGATLAEYTEFTGTVQTWTKSYVYLGDNVLSTISPNGIGGDYTEYNHPDQLGTRLITTPETASKYEQVTLPFGTALNAESSITNFSKRFTSYERSSRTGLDYAVNRTYDSKLGRFTQVDPIGIGATNLESPQTLNLYSYCGNDPVNHTDPDGLFWGAIGKFFKKLGKILSKIGHAINQVLNNIAVQVALTALAAIVTFGTSLIAAASILTLNTVAMAVPTWLTIASWVVTAASYASKISAVLEISGILLQGKIKRFAKIIGMAFVGALVGVIEDSIRNGFLEGLKTGNPFSGAWNGFKKGIGYVKEIFSRKWKDWLIPIYGFFCGPGWGIDSSSRVETPIDGQDKACKMHDEDSLKSRQLNYGKWERDWVDLKLIGRSIISSTRSRLVDRVFGSGYKVGDVYGSVLTFGFSARIVGRHVGLGR